MPPDLSTVPVGLEHAAEREVRLEWTIAHHDPSLPAVLSTPAMIGLMEMAAGHAVEPALATGQITVGTRIEVDHLKSCGPGSRVRVWAKYTGPAGRFLAFDVTAHCGEQLIGRGRVFRAIVDPQRLAGAQKNA